MVSTRAAIRSTAMGAAVDRDGPARTLNVNLFERLCAREGAETERGRAKLLMVDRATLRRWRMQSHTPSMIVATWIASRLGVSLDELFPVRETTDGEATNG